MTFAHSFGCSATNTFLHKLPDIHRRIYSALVLYVLFVHNHVVYLPILTADYGNIVVCRRALFVLLMKVLPEQHVTLKANEWSEQVPLKYQSHTTNLYSSVQTIIYKRYKKNAIYHTIYTYKTCKGLNIGQLVAPPWRPLPYNTYKVPWSIHAQAPSRFKTLSLPTQYVYISRLNLTKNTDYFLHSNHRVVSVMEVTICAVRRKLEFFICSYTNFSLKLFIS